MTSGSRVPPLRWIFPLAQLFLCAVILWPMRPMLIGQIRGSLREYGIVHDTPPRNPVTSGIHPFDLSDPVVQRRMRISQAREWAVAALNLPGGLPELAYAILSPAHSEWIPRGMFMWTWRDLSWPITGIFFWWLAGRSIEALLFSRRKILVPKIRWWEVLASLPALAFGAIFALGLCIGRIATIEIRFWVLLAALGSMWMVLGVSTSLAYFVQWRLRKRLATSAVEQSRMLTSAS